MFLAIQEVADRLKCSKTVIRKMVTDGKLKGLRIGRTVRVSQESLNEFLGSAGAVPTLPRKPSPHGSYARAIATREANKAARLAAAE